MQLQPQTTFLKALAEIMKDGIAAVTLSRSEVFFLANTLCPKEQQIRYGTYLRFLHSLDEYGEPTEPNEQTDLLLEIHDYLEAQEALQRRKLLIGIQDGQKDWRRFVWLLQYRQKEERLKLAQAKQQELERKEKQKAAEAVAKQEIPLASAPQPTAATIPPAPQPQPEPRVNNNAIQYRRVG